MRGYMCHRPAVPSRCRADRPQDRGGYAMGLLDNERKSLGFGQKGPAEVAPEAPQEHQQEDQTAARQAAEDAAAVEVSAEDTSAAEAAAAQAARQQAAADATAAGEAA